MAKNNQILVRVNDPTNEAVENYAEEYDLNKAEAVREMAQRVLRGEGYLETPGPAISDGGVVEKIDQTNDEIEKTQQKVEELNADIKKTINKHRSPLYIMVLGLAFMLFSSTSGADSFAATGLGVMGFVMAFAGIGLDIWTRYDS